MTTYPLSKDATVSIDGKEGKLVDVPTESAIAAKLAADQKTVLSLSAEGQSIKGVVKGADVAGQRITITVPVNKTEFEDSSTP